MNRKNTRRESRARAAQQGYSLVELSVAMLIALFLLAGFLTVLQGTRKTSTNQNLLAQLQDNQRIAMTMITNVIESAGYYPNPETNAFELELPIQGPFVKIGQVITGAANLNPALGDTMTIRYNAGANEDVIDCVGNSNGAIGSATNYVNQFAIQQPDPNQPPYLACSSSQNPGTFVKLVNNVSKMEILYGVNTLAAADNSTDGAVDSYLPAASMTDSNWTNVYSVKVKLTFINPLFSQPGKPVDASQKPTIPFTKVIGLMSRVGVDVVSFK
jgi:type IV pilus assembly protein PilW